VTIPLIFLSVIGVFALIEFLTHRGAVMRMEQNLHSMVQTQAAALANPMWNLDDEQIRLSLEAAVTNREVLSARVLNQDEELVSKSGVVPDTAPHSSLVVVSRDIVFDAGAGIKIIGQIEFTATRSFVWEQTRNRLIIAGIIALVAVTIEVGAALFALRTIIGRPLEKLLDSIERVRAGGERQAVDWGRTDELGTVIRSYNEMQRQQQDYESELRDARDTLEDRVTERTAELAAARDDSLKARARLDDAIEAISEGFSLYDAQDRLVVSNARYRELLGVDHTEGLRPGDTFESILRTAWRLGLVVSDKDEDAWIRGRIDRHFNPGAPHIQRYSNGRWVLVSERRTQDSGTVAVYSDITEVKQQQEDLAKKTAQLEQLSSQLAKYLSPQIYDSIFQSRQDVKIAASRKKLTVFFSDIEGFTETADRLESEELTALLNHYLTEMTKIALDHGATVDKYIGDAILIFFGDPETRGVQDDALACVHMAVEMRKKMDELGYFWRAAGIARPLRCRMGIHTDYCTVGNFGSEDRLDYTIIGRGVNIASRLETQAPTGEILISYETFSQISDTYICEELGDINAKGLAYPIASYRVVGPREEPVDTTLDLNVMAQTNPSAMSIEERQAIILRLQMEIKRLQQPNVKGKVTKQ
jgi:class 3 adenylate cyclase